MAKKPFTRSDVQQNDSSKDYPGNPWINRDEPFYDQKTWGANHQDPSEMDVTEAPGGDDVDMDTAGQNTRLPGSGRTRHARVPPAQPWKRR